MSDRLCRDFTDTGFSHPTFFKADNESTDLFCGVELEVEATGDLDDVLDAILANNKKQGVEFWKYKGDGSLTNGAECVTHPFSWNWYVERMEVEDLFEKFSTLAAPWNKRGAINAGIHIHLTRKAFSNDHLVRFMEFHYRNAAMFKRIAGSKQDSYSSWEVSRLGNRWDNDSGLAYVTMNGLHGALQAITKRQYGQSDRYMAINLQRQKTVEMRYFRSTSKLARFYGLIEWAFAVFEYTKMVEDCTEEDFVAFLEANSELYPNALAVYNGDETHAPEERVGVMVN